jgi:hypothetical protein
MLKMARKIYFLAIYYYINLEYTIREVPEDQGIESKWDT